MGESVFLTESVDYRRVEQNHVALLAVQKQLYIPRFGRGLVFLYRFIARTIFLIEIDLDIFRIDRTKRSSCACENAFEGSLNVSCLTVGSRDIVSFPIDFYCSDSASLYIPARNHNTQKCHKGANCAKLRVLPRKELLLPGQSSRLMTFLVVSLGSFACDHSWNSSFWQTACSTPAGRLAPLRFRN